VILGRAPSFSDRFGGRLECRAGNVEKKETSLTPGRYCARSYLYTSLGILTVFLLVKKREYMRAFQEKLQSNHSSQANRRAFLFSVSRCESASHWVVQNFDL
jgi:hypothetical protein